MDATAAAPTQTPQPAPPAPPPVSLPPPGPAPSRLGIVIRVLLGLVLLLLAAGLGLLRWYGDDSTNDAYVTGHIHTVAPRVAGTVVEVLVNDNQHVQAGQVVARLDARDFAVRRQLADAQIVQARAQQQAALAQLRQAEAALATARAGLNKAELDFKRSDELINLTPRGISRQEFDAARAALDGARAQVDAAHAQAEAAKANRAAAVATEDSGRANLHDADLALSYVDVVAPVSGWVGRKSVELGARVNVGQSLLAVVADDIWVVANFREVQLAKLAPGTAMRLKIDALPGQVFRGRVESRSPATGAQFSLLPPDNATGNFTKVVQRVPVKILFEPGELSQWRAQLIPGLSVVAELAPAATAARP